MTNQYCGLLGLLHDWQDLTAGLLATFAAFITITAMGLIARKQIRAALGQVRMMKEQIEDLRAARKKEAAISTLKACRVFQGIISHFKEMTDQAAGILPPGVANQQYQIRAGLPDLPVETAFEALGCLDPEFIKKYFELVTLLAILRGKDIRSPTLVINADELNRLIALTKFLTSELDQMIGRQERVLVDPLPDR